MTRREEPARGARGLRCAEATDNAATTRVPGPNDQGLQPRYDFCMQTRISADEIKALFHLEQHPREGGWFRQTWKADEALPASALAARYAGQRSAGTAIYYLLESNSFSEMHRLQSDEVFHFYLGDPVEMLQLFPVRISPAGNGPRSSCLAASGRARVSSPAANSLCWGAR